MALPLPSRLNSFFEQKHLANQKGWNGAKEGRSLQESCPRNPREYYHPKYYKKLFNLLTF